NIAVHDHDALRYVEFLEDLLPEDEESKKLKKQYQKIAKFLQNKQPNQMDLPEVRKIKGLIRRGEARAGARFCGLDDDHIHFLDMPFYETGKRHKKDLSEDDIRIVADLIASVRPHQVYAAGDLADP